jgi:asparagine synthase (glutamine-hydrolysing)
MIMCGIAGVLGGRDCAGVERMVDSLRHRGPDGIGLCSRGLAHLGATRLSIVDLAAGPQPIYNETRSLCLVFNGEVYNHRQLRADLECKGHVFGTQTDTEVVIHLYEEFGRDCVRQLRGMFAFAILDGSRMFLARDRLGIKPLYYAVTDDGKTFTFASEIKPILQTPGLTPQLSSQAFADALVLGHPVHEHTFFEGVRSLPAGHIMTVSYSSGIQIDAPLAYHSRDSVREANLSLDDAVEEVRKVLEDAVDTHLDADVEVGLTLSGGIDSTVLTLLAAERRRVVTFTVADHEQHPDAVQADCIAETIRSEHHKVVMSYDDYLAAIPALIATEEQPSSLYGLPYYFLCRRIANRVKACLHGEGADEMFGGYREYLDRDRRLLRYRQRLPLLKRLGVAPSDAAAAIIRRLSSAITFEEYLEAIFAVNANDALQRLHLDLVDKCSMAASVEMRVPYLDDRVFELVNRLPLRYLVSADLGIKKYILRRFALKRFGASVFDVILREKLGAPSAGMSFLNRFEKLCNEQLPNDYLRRHEYGFCFESKRQLLLFELFHEIFVRNRGDVSSVPGVVEFIRQRADANSMTVPLAM